MAEPLKEAESFTPDWDQLSIETPELVAIDMALAGIGSRFVALLVDYLLWLIAAVVIVFLLALIDPSLNHFSKLGEKWEMAVSILLPFLFYWGYFTLFEAFWDGRTPGKRIVRIRVIQRTGRGIGLFESMTRNLLRVVDQFPFVYVVGVVSIFLSKQQQRLGDMAAGTLVVHDRQHLAEVSAISNGRTFTAGMFEPTSAAETGRSIRPAAPEVAVAGVQRLGRPELELLEGFFARRLDFSLETRAALAQRIADGIRIKSGLEVPPGVSVESFLEEVARHLRDLARLG